MKIMILDDVAMNVKMLAKIVEPYGEVHGFTSANEALDELRQSFRAGSPYDILFLDIMMPDITGLKVLAAIRNMEQTYKQPERTKVIMVTARNEREIVVEAVRGGAVGYILKPFEHKRIAAEVERVRGMVAPAEIKPAADAPAPEAAPAGEPAPPETSPEQAAT